MQCKSWCNQSLQRLAKFRSLESVSRYRQGRQSRLVRHCKDGYSKVGTDADKIPSHYLRERIGAVFREHCDQCVENNVGLMFVSSGDFDKDILSRELDLGMFRVDDRREGAYNAVGIIDNGVDRRVADNVQVSTKVFIVLRFMFNSSNCVLAFGVKSWRLTV